MQGTGSATPSTIRVDRCLLNRACSTIFVENYLPVAIPLRFIAVAGSSHTTCRFQVVRLLLSRRREVHAVHGVEDDEEVGENHADGAVFR